MPAYTERPDSRYDAENLVAIDANDVARLDATAERMAYQPREDKALSAEWEAAYERTQADLMRRVHERKLAKRQGR